MCRRVIRMKKRKYTKTEQELNNVLKYQSEQLDKITFPSSSEIDRSIRQSEDILRMLGVDPVAAAPSQEGTSSREVIVVPSWAHLCEEAEKSVGSNNDLEDLFTEKELQENQEAVKRLNAEYNQLHNLDKYDIAISACAGILSAAVDILLVGIPKKTPEGLKGGPLANYIREEFDKKFPEEEMQKLANSKVSKVPFDAQDNRNTTIYVEGLSAYYHRLLSMGHDPLLGFVFGVVDILNGTMTTIDKKGKVVVQVMENYSDRKETDIFAAIAKQIIHLKSDMTTSMGLPAPMMELFNLLQFGDIGEYDQTIAEIVQGMYYEGYDFIHFCSLSIPVMLTEVIVRLGYAIKRIKEGHSIKESIPFSLDREKHPKLATMLFIGHSSATAINAGKIYFTKNPMAINYPQWLAFAKYTFQQVKWIIHDKSSAREAFVQGKLNEEMQEIFAEADTSFEELSKKYIVVMK